MRTLPEGALMQRAAAGLANAVLEMLGRAYGAHVLLLVGSGDNGGDALYAGALLARRGVRVSAWLLSEKPHEAGLAALKRAGGRTITEAPRNAPDLVVDGIVGIGGRPGLRPEAQQAIEALTASRSSRSTYPSGVDVDTGELDGPAVTRRRHRHLRHPQGRAPRGPGRPARRRRAPRRHRPRPPGRGSREPPGRRRRAPPAATRPRAPTSTPAASSASGPAPRSTPAPACSASPAPRAGCAGWSGTSPGPATRSSPAHPDVVTAKGRVQAWTVGSGGGGRRGDHARRGPGRRRTDRGRRRRPRPGRRAARRTRRAHARTPASSPG